VKNAPPIMRNHEEAIQKAESAGRHGEEILKSLHNDCSEMLPTA
jgi:uncharacterized membrane protein